MAVATGGRRPRPALTRLAALALDNLANGLTLFRLFAAVPVILLLESGWFLAGFALFVAAALTDLVDGYIAKRLGTCSALGAALDPLADKILMAAVLIGILRTDLLPLWFVLLVLSRDIALVGGMALIATGREARQPVSPLAIGKLCTALQLVLMALALAQLANLAPLGPAIDAMVPLVALATGLSALAYALPFLRRPAANLDGV